MTTRKIAAETTGPVTIDATLLGHGGTISVRAVPGCERATITVHTADEEGPAADAVREATLRQSGSELSVSVRGKGGNTGGTTTVISNRRGGSVYQSVGNITGQVVGMNIAGGNVTVNGVRISGRGGAVVINGSSPVEITAVVPVGSSINGRSQSADIIAEGVLLDVTGSTQSGDVRTENASTVRVSTQSGDVVVHRASTVNARTQSGDLRLASAATVDGDTMSGDVEIKALSGVARVNSMSGDVRIHAVTGGRVSAGTMSGDVSVTAAAEALRSGLDVRADSMTGDVRTPRRTA
ncbi:DUF4097 family beta strand repeat-containing protein [Streptomyces sindenensis]|uniref:DUF4097 family beta strand repeat-containing protein n=1 Tax=Streptomyces sindenensis TaxID=67363 RepID=A0ABW6EU19_9ACTN